MTKAFVKQKIWHAHGRLHELTKNHMRYFLKQFANICKMTFGYGGSASCSGMEFSQKFETVFLSAALSLAPGSSPSVFFFILFLSASSRSEARGQRGLGGHGGLD